MLDAAPTADVTIGLASSDSSEGSVTPTSRTFTASDWYLPQTVTVTGTDDSETDGAVGYTIVTAAAVSSDPNYSGMDAADVSVTNLDDEVPDNTCHIGDLDGAALSNKSKWRTEITVLVHDQDHVPLADATVTGSWVAGVSGAATCTTDGTGLCTVTSADANKNVSAIAFSVDDASHASFA